MFYAMKFIQVDFNKTVVRPIRKSPYKTLEAAIAALTRTGLEGYVKQFGEVRPAYHNCKV